jgi:hypothetical protein
MQQTIELDKVFDLNEAKERIYNEDRRLPFILRGINIGSCQTKWTQLNYLQELGKNKQVKVHVCTHESMDFINKNFLYKLVLKKI